MKSVTPGTAELSWSVVNQASTPTLNDKDKNGTLNTFHSLNSAHFSLEWSRYPVEKNLLYNHEKAICNSLLCSIFDSD